MALNIYIVLTSVPALILGTAYVFVSDGVNDGLIYLFAVAIVFIIILMIDHSLEISRMEYKRRRG